MYYKTIIGKKISARQKISYIRYRIYAIIVIVMLTMLTFGSDVNTKTNVGVDPNKKIVTENILARKIEKTTKTNTESIDTNLTNEKPLDNQDSIISTNLSSATTSNSTKDNEEQVNPNPVVPDTLLVRNGRYAVYNESLEDITDEFIKSNFYQSFNETNLNNQKELINLEYIIPAPDTPIRQNWLIYPKYNIQSPILYGTLSDLYTKSNDNQYYNYNRMLEQSSKTSPIQTKLVDGIVHLGNTVQPGDVGNSYIVGHSSNFSDVKSDYNTIFKPIEGVSEPGEKFIIYDQLGRELEFCVFETLEIAQEETDIAYKDFDGERVVTLQTSVLKWKDGSLQATHRWLTRGKLCNSGIEDIKK